MMSIFPVSILNFAGLRLKAKVETGLDVGLGKILRSRSWSQTNRFRLTALKIVYPIVLPVAINYNHHLNSRVIVPHRDLDVQPSRFERWMMKRSRASHHKQILQIPAEYSPKLR